MLSTHEEFVAVVGNNEIVNGVLQAGGNLQDVIVALDRLCYSLMMENRRLRAICPTRTKLPDGTVAVWHCPDALIPLTDFSGVDLSPPAEPS